MFSTFRLLILCLVLTACNGEESPDLAEKLKKIFLSNFTEESESDSVGVTCGINKECVLRHLCSEESQLNTDGARIFTFRLNADSVCPFFHYCCDIGKKIDKKPEFTATPRQTTARGCGLRNTNGLVYKIADLESNEPKYSEFPWTVLLMEQLQNGTGKVLAAGAVIAPNAVLTAAHVLTDPDIKQKMIVRAGEWDLQSESEFFAHQDRNIKDIIQHEQFNPSNGRYDIAILLLDKPFDFDKPNVGTICLPKPEDTFDWKRCLATGWGKEKFGRAGQYRNTPKVVELPIVPNAPCQRALRDTALGPYFELHETFLCAGGEAGKDTCQGDGGAALMCADSENPDRYMQVGIVSWGLQCGIEKVPAAYANVMVLRKWVDEQMTSRGISTDYYTP